MINSFSVASVGFFCLGKYIKFRNSKKIYSTEDLRTPWLWRNTFCSLIHSMISSAWTIICYLDEPKLLNDMINTTTSLSTALIMFSTGYFAYDFIDTILHDKFRQWPIIFHHVTVLLAFGISLSSKKYTGFAVCSLLMEFNSIFLHLRRLMKLSATKNLHLYKLNSTMVLLTLIFCRILTSAWMIRWLLQNRHMVSTIPYVIGCVGMVVIMATNIGLLYRLCASSQTNKNCCLK